MTTSNWGAVVLVENPIEDDKGNVVYAVRQAQLQSIYPAATLKDRPRFGDQISFGPLSIDFRVDLDKQEFTVTVSLLGIGLGTFYASFSQGVVLEVNLFLAKGTLRFYVQDSALLVDVNVSLTFDGGIKETYTIYSWK